MQENSNGVIDSPFQSQEEISQSIEPVPHALVQPVTVNPISLKLNTNLPQHPVASKSTYSPLTPISRIFKSASRNISAPHSSGGSHSASQHASPADTPSLLYSPIINTTRRLSKSHSFGFSSLFGKRNATLHYENSTAIQPTASSPVSASTSKRNSVVNINDTGSVASATTSSSALSSPVKETSVMIKNIDPSTGNKMINNYMIIKELGRGVHGKVKLCVDTTTDTGTYFAIKIVHKKTKRKFGQKKDDDLNKIMREIAIMKKCVHNNIVQLFEVIDDPNSDKIYLVLEFVDGGEIEWKDEEDRPVVPLEDARLYVRDVVLGLEYLHYQGIIHRDIKPQNLLITKNKVVKIADFGVSVLSSGIGSGPATGSEELELAKTAGSPAFFAPELCADEIASGIRNEKDKDHVLDFEPKKGYNIVYQDLDDNDVEFETAVLVNVPPKNLNLLPPVTDDESEFETAELITSPRLLNVIPDVNNNLENSKSVPAKLSDSNSADFLSKKFISNLTHNISNLDPILDEGSATDSKPSSTLLTSISDSEGLTKLVTDEAVQAVVLGVTAIAEENSESDYSTAVLNERTKTVDSQEHVIKSNQYLESEKTSNSSSLKRDTSVRLDSTDEYETESIETKNDDSIIKSIQNSESEKKSNSPSLKHNNISGKTGFSPSSSFKRSAIKPSLEHQSSDPNITVPVVSISYSENQQGLLKSRNVSFSNRLAVASFMEVSDDGLLAASNEPTEQFPDSYSNEPTEQFPESTEITETEHSRSSYSSNAYALGRVNTNNSSVPASKIFSDSSSFSTSDINNQNGNISVPISDYSGASNESNIGIKKRTSSYSESSSSSKDIADSKLRLPIGKAIDIWALGVTLYCIIYGRLPFIAGNEFELFAMIPSKEVEFPKETIRGDLEKTDPDLITLLKQLLEKDPNSRITFDQIKRHPWLYPVIPNGFDPIAREKWAVETNPSVYLQKMMREDPSGIDAARYDVNGKIIVTDEEVRGAITVGVIRKWVAKMRKKFSQSINSLFHPLSSAPSTASINSTNVDFISPGSKEESPRKRGQTIFGRHSSSNSATSSIPDREPPHNTPILNIPKSSRHQIEGHSAVNEPISDRIKKVTRWRTHSVGTTSPSAVSRNNLYFPSFTGSRGPSQVFSPSIVVNSASFDSEEFSSGFDSTKLGPINSSTNNHPSLQDTPTDTRTKKSLNTNDALSVPLNKIYLNEFDNGINRDTSFLSTAQRSVTNNSSSRANSTFSSYSSFDTHATGSQSVPFRLPSNDNYSHSGPLPKLAPLDQQPIVLMNPNLTEPNNTADENDKNVK